MKIAKTLLYVMLAMCVAFTFVGCNEKDRKTADINAFVNVFQTNYQDFFNENGEFDITYENSVQNLIANDAKVALLDTYFETIGQASYHFFNLTKQSITDDGWKKEFRIDVYNHLKDLSEALQNFKNAKQRLETALEGYQSGSINNIQYSNLTNYIKEYGDFISTMQEFQSDYIDAYFNNFATTFYSYDGSANVSAQDLKVFVAHKMYDLAKMSYNLEYVNYYDLENAQFMDKVVLADSTVLCNQINALKNFESTIAGDLSEQLDKDSFKMLINAQSTYQAELKSFDEALEDFDYKKMRKSNETESAYVAKLDYKNKNIYDHIFYIAYDYILQVVNNIENAFI